MNFIESFKIIAATDTRRCCYPLADTIHCEYYCIFERRRKERTCCVAQMVLREEESITEVSEYRLEGVCDDLLLKQLLF